jgi:hypothetical protein
MMDLLKEYRETRFAVIRNGKLPVSSSSEDILSTLTPPIIVAGARRNPYLLIETAITFFDVC